MAKNFTADGPVRKWGADISCVWTAEGWTYLAVVMDGHRETIPRIVFSSSYFSRRVISWATDDRLKRDLTVETLRRAVAARNPAPGLVHHSDRRSQYCSVDYQGLRRKRGILVSMSRRGNFYNNAMVETSFKTIRSELIWPIASQSRQRAEDAVPRYIYGLCNPVRQD